MSDERKKRARVPPRFFVRFAWSTHRGLYRVTGGRFGLRRAKANRWGMMHLTTTGRKTGQKREVIIGYLDDGPNLVALAMNGWADNDPAWWLNLQAAPNATVDLANGPRQVQARAAQGEERARLWDRWRELDKDLDGYASLRSAETAVVILE
jgi:deazaflavin-dependent oxidoreductase (nitroreductase family)